MEPIEPPWQAIKEWIPDDEPDLDWFNRPRNPSNPDPDGIDQSPMPLRVRDRDCFFEDPRGGIFRFRPVLHWLPQGSRTASSGSFFDQCADAQVFQYPLGIDRQSFVTKGIGVKLKR